MILVTGATGTVGGELVARLAAAGQPVRAMTRRPDSATLPAGATAVYGDAADPASLTAAFDGADRAFLMSAQQPGSVGEPTHDLALVEAARRAGVRHVVKLSVYSGGAGDGTLAAWHGAAEAAVIGSGLEWTLLRPGRFMTNALGWAPMIRRGDDIPVPFATFPAASIDPADIAAVAAAALTGDRHYGTAYRMTGPEILTPAEELAILGAELGRSLRAVEPPADAVRAGMVRSGMAEAVVDEILARMKDGAAEAEVLPTVAQVLGRPPASFAQWAARNRDRFAS
jgi:uncharacterized protein YbjT (DUF2867 family)